MCCTYNIILQHHTVIIYNVMHFCVLLNCIHVDLERAKALSMQERQPVSPRLASPTGSYEEIGDRDSVDSLTPLHSVSSWLNIPSEPGEATNWVDQSYPRRSTYCRTL